MIGALVSVSPAQGLQSAIASAAQRLGMAVNVPKTGTVDAATQSAAQAVAAQGLTALPAAIFSSQPNGTKYNFPTILSQISSNPASLAQANADLEGPTWAFQAIASAAMSAYTPIYLQQATNIANQSSTASSDESWLVTPQTAGVWYSSPIAWIAIAVGVLGAGYLLLRRKHRPVRTVVPSA